jgi:Domain of unknown function (DUF3303)
MPLYLVEHRHAPADCRIVRGTLLRWAEERPAQLRALYWEPGAHRGWFIVEADDHEHLNDLIGQLVEHSHNETHPVLDLDQLSTLDHETR